MYHIRKHFGSSRGIQDIVAGSYTHTHLITDTDTETQTQMQGQTETQTKTHAGTATDATNMVTGSDIGADTIK